MRVNEKVLFQVENVIPFARSGDYYYNKGLKAYRKKDLEKATQLFKRAIDVEPEEPAYLCQLAATLAELGDFLESNDLLEYIVSDVDSEISECYYFMANNYAHLGMFREAESEAVRYMEHEPEGEFYEDCEELLNLIHTNFGEFGEDEEHRTSEEKLIVKHEQARGYLEKGDYAGARDLLKKMIAAHPDFWAAYNNLALAHFYLGEYEAAFTVLDDVLDKDTGNLHALCNIALFYKQLQQTDELNRFLRCLKVIHPMIPEHRYKLGSTFALLGEDEDAFKWLVTVKNQGYARNATYFHWLAVASVKTGRINKAQEIWGKIIDLEPKGSVAPYYLEKLKNDNLHPEEAEYQYVVPSQSQGKERTQFHTTSHKNKLSHLLLLRQWKKEDALGTLKAFCVETKESNVMKELAATLLFELGDKTVQIQSETGMEEYVRPSEDMKKGLRILESVIAFQEELDSQTAMLWHLLMHEAKTRTISLANINAWAGAIVYVAAQVHGKPSTQEEISDQFGISGSTVQKYVKSLKFLYQENSP